MSDFQPRSDPEFGGIVAKRFPDESLTRNRRFSPFLVLIVISTLALLTFVVVSEYETRRLSDSLDHPVAVKAMTSKALALADGRQVSLPFIKSIPWREAVFAQAIKDGVEVDERGSVFGLLTVYSSCGMTLCRYRVTRINLSELVGVLAPECVDDTAVSAEELAFLRENYVWPKGMRFTEYLWNPLRQWHDTFERAGRAAALELSSDSVVKSDPVP
jgi:hypothetical protein